MLKSSQLTPKQAVQRYALAHGLTARGSDIRGVMLIDQQGHYSEAWGHPFETWEAAQAAIIRIEHEYHDTLKRPWEALRSTYTGKMR